MATTNEKEDLSSYILGEDEEVRELFGLSEVVGIKIDETKTKDVEVSSTWSQWSLNVAPTLKFPIHTKRMKKEEEKDGGL
jgi:hypothetical protein